MYPELFHIGDYVVTTFGLMVAVGVIVGLWLLRRELTWSGLPEQALDGALIGVAAGLAGAKLLYVFEHMGEEPMLALLTSRGGMSWFGGFFGGVGSALLFYRLKRWPILSILSAATPALAIGHAIGRIGCFLVGDDYGRPSDLPWAVAFPKGAPPTNERVHPTQLYEMLYLLPVAWLLVRWRRQHVADRVVVGRYLALTAAARFAIEFVRVNERVALGLTVAQWSAVIVLIAAAILIGRRTAPVTTSELRHDARS